MLEVHEVAELGQRIFNQERLRKGQMIDALLRMMVDYVITCHFQIGFLLLTTLKICYEYVRPLYAHLVQGIAHQFAL